MTKSIVKENIVFLLAISFTISLLILFLTAIFSFLIAKKQRTKDNKLLNELGMECDGTQDIQIASNYFVGTTYFQINVVFIGFLMVICEFINILSIYSINNKHFDDMELWIIVSSSTHFILWFVYSIISWRVKKYVFNPKQHKLLINFLSKYKVSSNNTISIKRLPPFTKSQVKNIINRKYNIMDALVVVSKYNLFKNDNLVSSKGLFDYIISNCGL